MIARGGGIVRSSWTTALTDLGSAVEREFQGFGGYSGFLLNSWEPELQYSYSDFDVRHQMNLNWVTDLPFGRGRRFGDGVPGWLNQVIGNWQFSGLFRWTSGFPFNIINSRCCWPTNWNYQGNAELAVPGQLPGTTIPAIKQANALKKSLIREKRVYLIPVKNSRPRAPLARLSFPPRRLPPAKAP